MSTQFQCQSNVEINEMNEIVSSGLGHKGQKIISLLPGSTVCNEEVIPYASCNDSEGFTSLR